MHDELEIYFNENLISSPIIKTIYQIAKQRARPDGWLRLKRAEHFINQLIPDEINKLETSYGYKTLEAAILATDIFDIKTESTSKGSTRTVYRIKPSASN